MFLFYEGFQPQNVLTFVLVAHETFLPINDVNYS